MGSASVMALEGLSRGGQLPGRDCVTEEGLSQDQGRGTGQAALKPQTRWSKQGTEPLRAPAILPLPWGP